MSIPSLRNGHYACTCYHPLFVFNHFGDLERCALRPGNVHSADGWMEVLDPVVARYRGKVSRIYFRTDAGFANPEVYDFLEAERIKYAIRLPANRILQDRIGYLLKRPFGQPPNKVRRFHANFSYQAGSWTKCDRQSRVASGRALSARRLHRHQPVASIGAKVVSHGRYVAFQMAEVAIPRQMFQEILRLIGDLRPRPPPAPA